MPLINRPPTTWTDLLFGPRKEEQQSITEAIAAKQLGLLGSPPVDTRRVYPQQYTYQSPSDRQMFELLFPQGPEAAMGLAMPIAYHGTPNYFDKFSTKKIGTGEGAQSYGHGMYFAESPAVAKEYQNTLSQGIKGGGYMYKVDIKPSPDKFLDWDKPLKHQSDEVKKAINSMAWDEKMLANIPGLNPPYSGPYAKNIDEIPMGDIYSALSRKFGSQEEASKYLNSFGVPGIRYLDQGSRKSTKGTYNYVVFDDANVNIIERK